ncbi:glutaredoxin family protein [Gloeobacter violaceus]|uniref:Gsl3494 protein n=1 Tax=Gloeobacter violaceus (strain ATCC 29082 / PCC 7421) TaxID=251221 RepID=Q7NFN0_GLOVI|nr:glutaredoxin family protein [Gloeobacter violaceus]BAC91435.1 gsl3494 [Gloeobacter violaceus PCC 7421]
MDKIVVFYSKPGCCLCDALEATLRRVQPDLGLSVEKRNILSNPEWFTDFQYTIPVLEVNGHTLTGISHRSTGAQLAAVLERAFVA